MQWMKLTGLMMLLSASGCAGNSVNDYCLIAKPILVSEADLQIISDALVTDILAHDEQYDAVCN